METGGTTKPTTRVPLQGKTSACMGILVRMGALGCLVRGVPTIEADMQMQTGLLEDTTFPTEVVSCASFINNVGVCLQGLLTSGLSSFFFAFLTFFTRSLMRSKERLRSHGSQGRSPEWRHRCVSPQEVRHGWGNQHELLNLSWRLNFSQN